MRIGVISQWYPPEPGGGVIPGVLADSLVERGHRVSVLTGFPNYPTGRLYEGFHQRWGHRERPDDLLSIRRVPLVPSHDQNPLARAANYLSFAASASLSVGDLAGSDALWVYNSPETVGLVARLASRRANAPYLLHIMDLWPDSVLDSGMLSRGIAGNFAGRGLRRLVDFTHGGATHIAVTSPSQRDILVARGVPASKLSYVPVWADERVFFPRPIDRALLPAEARDAGLVLMYAGAMGHVQKLDTAIRAVAGLAGHGVHLVLVGSGIAEKELRALTEALRARNVHFLGRRPANEMGPVAAAADAHLVSLADSPLLRATMPSKVQSIFALGRPVIATCSGDAARTIHEASGGVVLEQGDVPALRSLLEQLAYDPAPLRIWGSSARAYYERYFSRERATTQIERILGDIA